MLELRCAYLSDKTLNLTQVGNMFKIKGPIAVLARCKQGIDVLTTRLAPACYTHEGIRAFSFLQ